MENGVRDLILGAVDEPAAIDLLRRAVATPSVTGQETVIAQLFAEALLDSGADEANTPEFEPGRRNAWGVFRGTRRDAAGLMLLGHIDTVHVRGWETRWADTSRQSPFCAEVVDGAMWGRGTADQKAGVVAVISALQTLRHAGLRPQRDVVALFVGDEESGEPGTGYSDGIKALLPLVAEGRIPRTSFAVYTEPTTLQVYGAQMGFLIADITVHGESAYFGKPWLGRDALRATHRLLSRLWAYSDELWLSAEHPLLGHAFLLVTGIEGGGYVAVPGECKLSLIRKILPHEDLDAVRADLEARLQQAAIEDDVRTTIDFTAPRDHPVGGMPSEASLDNPAIAMLQRIAADLTRGRGGLEGAPYWSEMSFVQNELGIPAVYFAPGDIATAHTHEERVDVEEFLTAVRIFALFIAEYCGIDDA